MKKLFLSLFILLICCFNSCKKDDGSSSSLIVGRWTLLPTNYEWYNNGTLSNTSFEKYDVSDYAEFKKDGTLESKANGGPLSINTDWKAIQSFLTIQERQKLRF